MLSYHLHPNLEGYDFGFSPTFFNKLEFQLHQSYDPLYSFYILNQSTKNVVGFVHFTQVGEFAFSQPRAPFGGFELDISVREVEFREFLAFIHDTLKGKGIKRIKIVEPPDIFGSDISFDSTEVLYEHNYQVVAADVNHYVNLDDTVGMEHIHQMERRNFRKALAKGYKWKLESLEVLPEVYSFIERCRAQNDLHVNIKFEDLNRSFKRFPGVYRIFSIRHHDYLAAASITVEANQSILYNFLPASDKRFKADSPMVFLLVSLYKYAKSLGYEVLDLGVSSIEGEIQSGLAEFKERMGALICERRILEKKLN